MTILNQLDTGASHPWLNAHTGQVVGAVHVEAFRTIYYARGRKQKTQDVTLYVRGWQGYGTSAAAGSGAANKYLLAQLEELLGNRDLQPVYIQWTQTADPAAGLAASELHDGWYVVQDFEAPYTVAVVTGGILKCRLTVEYVAAPPPARVGVGYVAANLATNYTGTLATPLTVLGVPVGSTLPSPQNWTRTGGEGAVPLYYSPAINPFLFQPSATVANWWKGGGRVFDTVNTASNPVPSAASTFTNANWVEVLSSDHAYQGDCFLTNGLLGLLLQAGTTNMATAYLWSTVTSAWVNVGAFQISSLGTLSTNYGYAFDAVGQEEAIVTVSMGGGGQALGELNQIALRLQRGCYHARIAWTVLGESSASSVGLQFTPAAATPLYVANPSAATGVPASGAVSLANSTAYGYATVIPPQAGTQYMFGYLWQNQPTNAQPQINAPGPMLYAATITAGQTRLFGFFALPFASTVNLSAQGESGTLGTGWSSVADAGATGGNAAKAASGTVAANADLFGTSWVPPGGAFDVWFRVRVTSAAGSTGEMTLGLWDVTSAAFVTNGSTTFAANAAATTYVWLKANTALVTPTAAHNVQFRAVTAATLGTDWFVDEALLVPTQLNQVAGTFVDGPLDIFRQFLGDRTTRQLRL